VKGIWKQFGKHNPGICNVTAFRSSRQHNSKLRKLKTEETPNSRELEFGQALPQNPFLVLSRELIGPLKVWVFTLFELKTAERPETTKNSFGRIKIA